MTNNLNTLAPALYVKIGDTLNTFPEPAPWRPKVGVTPTLGDAEPVTLAVQRAESP